MEDAYKFIQEDKREHYSMLLMIAPVSRTAMDAKGARQMNKYYKDISKTIDGYAPWVRHTRRKLLQAKVKNNVESGNVVVKLGPGDDPTMSLFKGAKIV